MTALIDDPFSGFSWASAGFVLAGAGFLCFYWAADIGGRPTGHQDNGGDRRADLALASVRVDVPNRPGAPLKPAALARPATPRSRAPVGPRGPDIDGKLEADALDARRVSVGAGAFDTFDVPDTSDAPAIPDTPVTPVAPVAPARMGPELSWAVDIGFGFDSATVKDDRVRAMLMPLVQAANRRPCRRLVVDGHTNDVGDRDHNMALSWRRAMATRNWLAEQGVPDKQIVVRSFGAYQPKISLAPTAREQRRVEIRMLECNELESQP